MMTRLLVGVLVLSLLGVADGARFSFNTDGACAAGDYWIQADATNSVLIGCSNGAAFRVTESIKALSWFFPGTPTAGVQTARAVVPAGAANCAIANTRYTVNTTSGSSSTFNIQRCTANCTTGSPTFANIYSSDITLAASNQTVAGGTANLTTTIVADDQFKANVVTVGASLADVTVTLTYQCDN